MSNIINQNIQMNEDSLSSQLFSHQQSHDFLQTKFTQIIDKYPKLKPDQAFYLEYCKLYISTLQLQQKVSKTQLEVEQLRKISTHTLPKQKKMHINNLNSQISNSQRKKRIRRTANQIARHYVCKVEKCQKSYGSQGSLNQHIKLKHKQLYEAGFFGVILS